MSSKIIKKFQKILGVTAAASLAAIAIPTTGMAAPEEAVMENQGEFQVAQATNSCREVDSDSGLNVRSEPWGSVIGTLENNENIYLENPAIAGGDWVEIQSPMNGVVAAKFLDYCTTAMPEPMPDNDGPIAFNDCRQISAAGGLNVRTNPEIGSPVITTLPNNAEVEIESRGMQGWVPLENYDGYVAGNYLTYCD